MDESTTPSLIFEITLDCDHRVFTPIVLRLQYPDDVHYIFCPFCREYKDNYAKPTGNIDSAWRPIVRIKEMMEDALLRNVHGESAFIVSRDILRVQPSVPGNRSRPFPYVPQRRGFTIS